MSMRITRHVIYIMSTSARVAVCAAFIAARRGWRGAEGGAMDVMVITHHEV